MSKSRRGQTGIIREILAAASAGGVTKTTLVYNTNFNFRRVERYINLLLKKNLLERLEEGSQIRYRTTREGLEAMAILEAADRFTFELPQPKPESQLVA